MITRRPSLARTITIGLRIGAASSVLLCAPVARAQGQPSRPPGGVYGGAGATPRDRVSASVSAYGAEDQQLSGGPVAIDSAGVPVGEPYTGTDISLAYIPSRRGGVDFDFRGTSGVRYYPGLSETQAATQSANLGAGMQLTRRTALQMRGGVGYSPYLDYSQPVGLDPNAPATPERIRDNRVATRRLLSYDGSANYTYEPSNRTSVTLLYGVRHTELLDESQSSLDTTVSAGFSRRLSRNSSGRVTYIFRDGDTELNSVRTPTRLHDVDFGYDLEMRHSATRRTTISFSGGPSLVSYQGRDSVRAFGGVTLTHPFARDWNLRAFYRRGMTFLDGTNQPFLTDSFSAGVSGLVTRRLDVSVSAGAILGDIGLEAGGVGAIPVPYDTYTGSGRVRYGLTNSIALFGEYLASYSRYNINNNAAPLAPGLNRGGLRFGLNLYVPIVRDPPPAPGARGGARR